MTHHQPWIHMLGMRADLSDTERVSLHAHLQTCRECQAIADEYARQDAFLRALQVPEPSPALRRRVLEEVGEARSIHPHAGWRQSLSGVPAAVVLAAVLVAAVVLPNHGGALHLPGSMSSQAGAPARVRHGPGPRQKSNGNTHQPANFGPIGARDGVLGANRSNADGAHPAPGMHTPAGTALKRSSSTDRAAPASPLVPPSPSVTVVTHGVRLTLSLPVGPYVHNGLIRTRVRLQNVSRRPIRIAGTPDGECGSSTPQIQMRASNGIDESFMPLPGGPIPSCPLIPPNTGPQLWPGQSQAVPRLVILRSSSLRAILMISTGRGTTLITTPPITITLGRARAPRIRLVATSPPAALVTAHDRHSGPLYYLMWSVCVDSRGRLTAELFGQTWHSTRSTTLRPPNRCGRVSEWHAVAGYLNQPVTVFNYKR